MILLTGTLMGGCAKKAQMAGAPQGGTTSPAIGGEAGDTSNGGLKEEGVNDTAAAATGDGSAAVKGLATIYFDFDSYTLSDASRQSLVQNSEWLKSRPEVKTKIAGHADDRGSDEYNMSLGEKRAQMAMDYLLNLGIPADRMSTISYGEEMPAVQGDDEGAWSKNRRVEFL